MVQRSSPHGATLRFITLQLYRRVHALRFSAATLAGYDAASTTRFGAEAVLSALHKYSRIVASEHSGDVEDAVHT